MWGFLGVGNGMINAFSSLIEKASSNAVFNKLLNAFAYGIDLTFLIGLLLVIVGLVWTGIEFYLMRTLADDEDKHREAKNKLKKAAISTSVFFGIFLLIPIIGFVVAGIGL